MATHSTDKDGVLRYVNDLYVAKFDRVSNLSVAGWSAELAKLSHFKTCNETTGAVTAKHP